MEEHVQVHVDNAVATITLARPERRNALTASMLIALDEHVATLDENPDVRVIILTGTDPAFCAGIDLTNLANELRTPRPSRDPAARRRGLLPDHDTPIIGAINGAAVTGGLELALGCDFLIASERAAFADTHARVGVVPGGGMSIRLPELVGIDRARRMSMTGDFVDAATALSWGLVTEVVAHDQLMERANELATSIAAIDPAPLRAIRRLYDECADLVGQDAYDNERRAYASWMREGFDPSRVAGRASAVIERGSAQL